jgi:predicted acetyltransferase
MHVEVIVSAPLDVHPASGEELIAAHRNVFDIWSKGLPIEDHVRNRLESPSHTRATWYVGTVDGQVVTSLGCYPLRFRVRGDELRGIAIGSVYTVSECRGRGFAPKLIARVEDDERGRGAALSVLYSDIEPQYYARRGYTLCPSWEGWSNAVEVPAPEASAPRLAPVSGVSDIEQIAQLYRDYHGSAPLSVARDMDYWMALFNKSPSDEFYALTQDGHVWLGYARVAVKGGAWRITDFALADQSDALAEQFYRALAAAAHAAGAKRVGGWLPDSAAAKKLFQLTPRAREITMIKSLSDEVSCSPDLVAATSRFCEIDHV